MTTTSQLTNPLPMAATDSAPKTADLAIEGMTCASCVARVEKALLRVPGVGSAQVNLATERARVQHDSELAADALIEAVRRAGYAARAIAPGRARKDQSAARAAELRSLRRALLIAALVSAPIILIETGSHVSPAFHHALHAALGSGGLAFLVFALATIVQFGPGRRFYEKGLPALLRGAPDMNSLVALGTTAAYGYSVVTSFFPQFMPEGAAGVYFEASSFIITLILLGRYLEALSKGRTSEAIQHLIGLQPKTAHVLRDGRAVDVPLESVRAGDVVVVRPGDKLPVDGVVVDGESYVNESMITGEADPVHKLAGAAVVGGTLNTTGSFNYRATKVGADTMLARIIALVETAQGSKLPIQASLDRITAWFVPAVMLAAALTFLVWLVFGPDPALRLALVNAVAVLIIACPCAMGLATPTSIVVGTGRAAELGVLFRDGEALQKLRKVSLVAFDKTGTLTNGQPELTDLHVTGDFAAPQLLAWVAAVETRSEHPIARALVAAAQARELEVPVVSDFSARPGHGVSGRVSGRRVHVGSARYQRELGIDVSAFDELARSLAREAKSPLYAAVDGRLAALIGIADPIKPGAAPAIQSLRAMGLEVAMISGDNRETASAVARQLGIEHVTAEVLPEGKLAALRALGEQGRVVAFVGDGINDAPALAAADVGIAIGTGTDVAIESAQVVLVSGELHAVANAVEMSRRTMANIHQNLFWAFAYNVILIPVAAGVLYPAYGILLSPLLSGAAMALSSVFVVGNALRLKRVRAA